MTSLSDLANEGAGEAPSILNELRLGTEPAACLLFEDDTQEVSLHYESDPSVRSYVICPGPGCPACFLGSAPKEFGLLPVLNIESGEVEVLRVSRQRGPGALLDGLLPIVKRSDLADLLVLIRRAGMRYSVSTQPLAEGATRHEQVIAAFQEAMQGGLRLSSAFYAPTASELAETERIRRKLDAMGGYEAPESDA